MNARLKLEFGSSSGLYALGASDHPNEMRFKGILVRLDEPSTKPPNGAEGHRIILPTNVAEKVIKTLIGMGLNYHPRLTQHAQTRKVGVINKAYIKGKDLYVEGTIWKHDFPEAEKDLKQPNLGMSMELSEVQIEDQSKDIWTIADCCFLGATILWKKDAAYYKTAAIAAKAEERGKQVKTTTVKKPTGQSVPTTQQIAKIAATAAVEANKPLVESMNQLTRLMAQQNTFMTTILSGGDEVEGCDKDMESDDGAGEVEQMTTKKIASAKKKTPPPDDDEADEDEENEQDEPEEMESEGVDKGSLEDVGEDNDEDDEAGHVNHEGGKNRGSDTSEDTKVGKMVNKSVLGAGMIGLVNSLRKENRQLKSRLDAAVDKLTEVTRQMNKVKKQVTASASQAVRKSVSPEIQGLLQKNGMDPIEMQASGTKLTVTEVDSMLRETFGNNLDSTRSMEFKNKLLRGGYMEEGFVTRSR